MEINTKKLFIAFRSDFEQAASFDPRGIRRGTISPRGIYAVAAAMAMWSWSDTQELEGINSLVAINCKRSPAISLPLLASRVATKKALGIGRRGCSLRFSNIKSRAVTVVDECSKGTSEKSFEEVRHTSDRWEPIDGSTEKIVLPAPAPKPATDRAGLWSTAQNILWHRQCKKPNVSYCFCLGEVAIGSEVFLCADKSWSLGVLFKAVVGSFGAPGEMIADLVLPFDWVMSTDLWRSTYQQLEDRDT
eukprot:9467843-Pyramimonas_sp.AAC.2